MIKPLRVLIVEDSPDDAELLIIALERAGYEPIYKRVENPEQMFQALESDNIWDIVIADHAMPEFSSSAALSLLQASGLDLPFIIVSGTIDENNAIAAMTAGAKDYFYKDQLGRLIPVIERELQQSVIRQERQQALEQIENFSKYSQLTGLPLLEVFLHHLQERMREDKDSSNNDFAILCLELDRFQEIKYILGNDFSNKVLMATFQRLQKWLSKKNIIAHFGLEKFLILFDNTSGQKAIAKAELLKQIFNLPFNIEGSIIRSSISIGIVYSQIDGKTAEELVQAADQALYHAKEQGKGQIALFEPIMEYSAKERLHLEIDLQKAIKCQELVLHYQPIVSLKNDLIVGFEALVRWEHPTKGLLSPDKFIPLAEETGLIIPLGKWVLTEACKRIAIWQQQFPQLGKLQMSVNLSGIQLYDPALISYIDNLLPRLKENLKLEITETVFLEKTLETQAILKKIKAQNIQIAIDDFGIGYSCLNSLSILPVDILKIDRCFVNPSSLDSKNAELVKYIIDLAHNLNLKVVAEGVETQEQVNWLSSLGCEYGQGYFFSRPLEPQAVFALLTEQVKLVNNLEKGKKEKGERVL